MRYCVHRHRLLPLLVATEPPQPRLWLPPGVVEAVAEERRQRAWDEYQRALLEFEAEVESVATRFLRYTGPALADERARAFVGIARATFDDGTVEVELGNLSPSMRRQLDEIRALPEVES